MRTILKRRDFLKLIGLSSAGSGLGFLLGESTKNPVTNLIPYVVPPEDIIPGVANWYATLCRQCNAGCGIVVRIMEGRAKKIEGNPMHPINRGRLCVRGQAGLQVLYNPDRIKGPLIRKGKRGDGCFDEISWEEGLSILSENLATLHTNRESDKFYLLTYGVRGHLHLLLHNFMRAYGSNHYLQYDLFQYKNLLFANKVSMGINTIPYYDIGNTKFLISFGADFLETWISPVNYSLGYGHLRQGRTGRRGRIVQIEPRLSLTGANADEWVPVRPGTEGLLAMGMAYTILKRGYYKGDDVDEWEALLKNYHPEVVSPITEVEEERISGLADELATTKPALALGGENISSSEKGISNLIAVNILNYLTGNIGKEGGIIPNREIPLNRDVDFKNDINTLLKDALQGNIKTLIIYNTNPLFTTPKVMKLQEALDHIPFIVSLSSSMDESTAMADLILPAHTYLEDWGDDFAEPGVGYRVATLMQPVVNPLWNTMSVGDIFLSLAKSLRGKLHSEIPWGNFSEFLKESWKRIYNETHMPLRGTKENENPPPLNPLPQGEGKQQLNPPPLMGGGKGEGEQRGFSDENKGRVIKEESFEDFWDRMLKEGVFWIPEYQKPHPIHISPAKIAPYLTPEPSMFDGDEKDYSFYLTIYPHSGFLDGRGANLPWLQEMPDPMTSAVWGSWVEMNPKTAKRMGLKEGEIVSVESPQGSVNLPLYLYPGIRPDTVSIPIGQGHRSYGRYAEGRGVNPLEIIPFNRDPVTGSIALNSTRVKIIRSAVEGRLVKMEGSTRELGRKVVQTITPEEFKKIDGQIF